ncbi:g2212 [Coccomyxa elongata]
MTSFLGTQKLSLRGNLAGTRLCPHTQTSRVQPLFRLPTSASLFGPGKKWEHYELNKNGKPLRIPMHVRTGDTVQVIAGKDKGKVGEVTKVLTKQGKIVVEGANIKSKTVQPKPGSEEKGQIVQTESPIHHSNVMLYSKEKQIRSRVGHRVLDDGRKVRYLVKTGEVIDS